MRTGRRSPRNFLLVFTVIPALSAMAQGQAGVLAPLNQFSLGAEYSNDSSHIILGQSLNRRLAGLDLTYSRRVGRKRWIVYDWDIETRPAVLIQDPTQTEATTIKFSNVPTIFQYNVPEQPIRERCTPGETRSSIREGTTATGVPIILTVDHIYTCGTRWTYAGGVSPVGQRLSFLPIHRVQPYLLANGGFLVSTRDVPAVNSSRFNFTFTFGGGLTWFAHGESAWSVDYRVQHLSNKNIGDNNPGVDS